MQRKSALLVVIVAVLSSLLLVGISLSTAAANSTPPVQNNLIQQAKASPTPTKSPPVRPGPPVLEDYDRDYEVAIAELQALELIPIGGELIFGPTSANRFGAGSWFIPLAARRAQTNFVMAGDILFTVGSGRDITMCVLTSRLTNTSIYGSDDYINIGFDNYGEVFVHDLFDSSSDSGYSIEVADLDLDFEVPHHLLFIMLDEAVTVFVDGELALEDVEVEARPGSFGLALGGGSATTRCDGTNIWIWELDTAWRGEEGVCGVVAASQINKREGPGTNFNLAGQLPARQVMDVDGQTTGKDGFVWYHLTDESWVRSDLVETIGPCEDAPEIE